MSDRTDSRLVEASLAGDQAAFGELTERYRSAAFGVAFHKLGDFEAARDAAQDALVEAYLKLPTLRDHEAFGSWLYQIAQTVALSRVRQRRHTASLDSDRVPEQNSATPGPQEAAEQAEKARRVQSALAALGDDDRLAVVLHYVDGYSHEEIGNMIGASESSVKNRVYRARRRLREEMLDTVERSLKDERSAEVKDLGIGIQWFGTQCHCRCRHCLLDNTGEATSLPFERVKALAGKFVAWRDERRQTDFTVDLITGYSCASPWLSEIREFNRQYGQTADFVSINGMAFMDEPELRAFMDGLKRNGTTAVSVTFYGLREFHDRFAGREGDYDFNMLAARVAGECGIHRDEMIFLSRDSTGDVPRLVDVLNALPGTGEHHVFPWDYRGRGKSLENERVLAEQIDQLPDEVKQSINLGRYASEAEWVRRIEAGQYPRKNRRFYIITAWEDNIDRLEAADCGDILRSMREEDEHLYQAIPSLPWLAELYGLKNGRKVYWIRDLEWKWIDRYLKAHPTVDPTGRFDDLSTVILWH